MSKRPFRLLDLPQEIIDMVYIQMLQAGYTGILCTSHEVHDRASQFIKGNAVCRMIASTEIGRYPYKCTDLIYGHPEYNLYAQGIPQYSDNRRLDPRRIQNVELRVIAPHLTLSPKWEVECFFPRGDCGIPKDGTWIRRDFFLDKPPAHCNSCHIIIETTCNEAETFGRSRMSKQLLAFAAFEKVTMSFAPQNRPGPKKRKAENSGRFMSASRERDTMYEFMEKALNHKFGPTTLVNDELEFQPWKNVQVAKKHRDAASEEQWGWYFQDWDGATDDEQWTLAFENRGDESSEEDSMLHNRFSSEEVELALNDSN